MSCIYKIVSYFSILSLCPKKVFQYTHLSCITYMYFTNYLFFVRVKTNCKHFSVMQKLVMLIDNNPAISDTFSELPVNGKLDQNKVLALVRVYHTLDCDACV